MKKIIITALLALVTIAGQAQDVNTCQPIAERILTAAQNHSSDGIDELLAPEFHFSNIKQPIAGKVLKQIIAQMPIITKWEQSNIERASDGRWRSWCRRHRFCQRFTSCEIDGHGRRYAPRDGHHDIRLKQFGNYWPQLHPSTVKGIKKAHLTGYGDGRASITKGKTTLTLGGRTFKKVQTAFSDVSHLKENKGIDGLFGCEVLAKQKLLISYKRQELILIDKKQDGKVLK